MLSFSVNASWDNEQVTESRARYLTLVIGEEPDWERRQIGLRRKYLGAEAPVLMHLGLRGPEGPVFHGGRVFSRMP